MYAFILHTHTVLYICIAMDLGAAEAPCSYNWAYIIWYVFVRQRKIPLAGLT